MFSTTVYLLLSCPILLFTIWYYTSTISPPPVSEGFCNKRVVLLIAHPDDESMFFSPALQALTDPAMGNHVKILCLSTGDSEGLGQKRRQELEKAALLLGVRRKEDVFVMDDPRFRDGMQEEWNDAEIARVLAQAFAPHIISKSDTVSSASKGVAQREEHNGKENSLQTKSSSKTTVSKPNKVHSRNTSMSSTAVTADYREARPSKEDGPKATIDVLLTFDSNGISGHPNHKSLYRASKLFVQQVMKGYAGYSCPMSLYTLTTTNVLRKYTFVLDLLPTYFISLFSSMFQNLKGAGQGKSVKRVSSDDRAIFVSDISRYLRAREAMVRGHESQMVWFRWGWISLGRYMVVNDLKKESIYGS